MEFSSLDIAVLLVFAGLAAFGIASQPRHHSTAAEWTGRFGLIGLIAWLSWVFFRPGGQKAGDIFKMFHDYFVQ
jgi:hypothetical protein